MDDSSIDILCAVWKEYLDPTDFCKARKLSTTFRSNLGSRIATTGRGLKKLVLSIAENKRYEVFGAQVEFRDISCSVYLDIPRSKAEFEGASDFLVYLDTSLQFPVWKDRTAPMKDMSMLPLLNISADFINRCPDILLGFFLRGSRHLRVLLRSAVYAKDCGAIQRLLKLHESNELDGIGMLIQACIQFGALDVIRDCAEAVADNLKKRTFEEFDVIGVLLTPFQEELRPTRMNTEKRKAVGWDIYNREEWLNILVFEFGLPVQVHHIDRAAQYGVIDDGLRFFVDHGIVNKVLDSVNVKVDEFVGDYLRSWHNEWEGLTECLLHIEGLDVKSTEYNDAVIMAGFKKGVGQPIRHVQATCIPPCISDNI
jgi:hypothetical protein